jgi:hypothetical protein
VDLRLQKRRHHFDRAISVVKTAQIGETVETFGVMTAERPTGRYLSPRDYTDEASGLQRRMLVDPVDGANCKAAPVPSLPEAGFALL